MEKWHGTPLNDKAVKILEVCISSSALLTTRYAKQVLTVFFFY